jgi:hypothetical protein
MSNNISKPLAFGEHAVCITNTSIHSFGELVDRLQLSLLPFSLTKLSLIIYIRKYLNGLPFRHSAVPSRGNLDQATPQHRGGKLRYRCPKSKVNFGDKPVLVRHLSPPFLNQPRHFTNNSSITHVVYISLFVTQMDVSTCIGPPF